MDYTNVQNAPIEESPRISGKESIGISRIGQDYYKSIYVTRPDYIHVISSYKANGPWTANAQRQAVLARFPKDKMVFIHHEKETGNALELRGWCFVKEITDAWEPSDYMPGVMTFTPKLEPMDTFDPTVDENKK